MKIEDEIYGNFEVEPVLAKVMKSDSVQRLKDISQFGVPGQYSYLSEKKSYSRFKHSVGVMLLLRRLGATIEEQLAGLIHDVSHTCFSHVVDWVEGTKNQENFQDDHHREYILESELPEILQEYDYNAEVIADESNFSLLEQELPELCADRIDYLLQEIPLKNARVLADELLTYKDKIIFRNRKFAFDFGNYFLDRQINHWGSYEAISRYKLFAEVLSEALGKGILDFEELWETESPIIKKLESCNNEKIKLILKLLKRNSLKDLPKSDQKISKKFRWVDPKFVVNDKVKKLSDVSEAFQKKINKARENNKSGVAIPNLKQI